MTDITATIAAVVPEQATLDVRTRRILEEPVLPLFLSMAWPNVLIMLGKASTGRSGAWFRR
jgi:hypothetical protein